jgi:hypothetical protein
VYSAQSDHLIVILAFNGGLMNVVVDRVSDVAQVEYIPDISQLIKGHKSGVRVELLQRTRVEFSGWTGRDDIEVIRWMKA